MSKVIDAKIKRQTIIKASVPIGRQSLRQGQSMLNAHSLSISWRSQGVMDNKRPFIKLGSAARHATGPLTQARSHRACLQSACFSLFVYGFFLLVSRNHGRMSTRPSGPRPQTVLAVLAAAVRACRGICGSLSRMNSSLAFA